MATINKSQDSADRRSDQGKGDLDRPGNIRGNLSLWGRSKCCNAPVMRLQGDKSKAVCEACGKLESV